MQEQNFKNHSQIVYSYYLMTGVPIIILIVLSIRKIINSNNEDQYWAILFLITGWVLLTMLFKSRGFALKAQDRAIRAEENLRHFALTGKLLDKRLSIKQIIALRFASDEEFPELAQEAAEKELTNSKIKQQIKNWRSDNYRI